MIVNIEEITLPKFAKFLCFKSRESLRHFLNILNATLYNTLLVRQCIKLLFKSLRIFNKRKFAQNENLVLLRKHNICCRIGI